ncbi:MAG TPA: hypothetical protein VMU25_04675 [Candidatus Paceibacterota bacterium]|nr:hypothetical protein [Candidatus Paceibacterota bacterium]
MTDTIEILPAVIPPDAESFGRAAAQVRSFSQWVHLDVEDGMFTENFSWPYVSKGELISASLMLPQVAIEAHLMVQAPEEVGTLLAGSGVRRIIAHIEAFKNPEEARTVLRAWRTQGVEVGLAILIETPLSALAGAGEECDCIQVMSIAKIGAHGAPFDARAIGRVGELHQTYQHAVIGVDGGISSRNIAELVRIGARRFAAGSAIFDHGDSTANYNMLKSTAAHAL